MRWSGLIPKASQEPFRWRWWTVLLLLLLIVGVESGVMVYWIGLNGASSLPVCCDFIHSVFDLKRMAAVSSWMDPAPQWEVSLGLAPIIAYHVSALLPGNEDFTLYTELGAMVLCQLLIFEVGRRLAGSGAGLVAAALMPLIPILGLLERRWDVYLMELPVVILGVLMVILSDGFRRLLPTLGFAGVLFLGAIVSPRATDASLVVATLASVGFAVGLRTLILKRGFLGTPMARWWGLLGLIVSVAAVVVFYEYGRQKAGLVVGYYRGQANSLAYEGFYPRWHWRQLTAYPAHLFWRGLSPWLAIPFEISLVAWLWRGKGRVEIGAWLVGLTLALSLIAKKNFYYLVPIYPALPLVIGLGAAAMPWRSVGIALAAGTLGIAGVEYTARAFPQLVRKTPLEGIPWSGGDSLFGGLIQTSDHDISLAPVPDGCPGRPDPSIQELTGVDSCSCSFRVAMVDVGNLLALDYRLLLEDPCLEPFSTDTMHWKEQASTSDVGLIIFPVGPNVAEERRVRLGAFQNYRIEKDAYLDLGRLGGCVGEDLRILGRSREWFATRCSPGRPLHPPPTVDPGGASPVPFPTGTNQP